MLKKLLFNFFLTIILIDVFNNPVFAATVDSKEIKIAVVVDTPDGKYSDPEKVNELIQTTINKIFSDSSKYDIISPDDTNSYVQIYREENNLTFSVDDDYTQTSGRDLSLKKDDLNKICKYFKADYIVYSRITNSAPRLSEGLMVYGQKVNVTLDFRVWSDSKSDFVYTKRVIKTGSSKTIYVGGAGSVTHAIEKGLKKDLQEINKDASKIRESMKK